MRLPDSVYRAVPGLYVLFGVITLYFSSEAYYLGRAPLYFGLLLVAGLALIINGILVVRVRRPNATPRGATLQQSK